MMITKLPCLTILCLLATYSSAYLYAEEAVVESPSVTETGSFEEANKLEPIGWVLRGLENNFGLEIDRSALASSQDRVEVTLGEFVTRFVSQARYSSSERRQNRTDFLATGGVADIFDEEILELRAGFEKFFSTGARASLSNISQRRENPTTRRAPDVNLNNLQNPTVIGPVFSPEFQSTTVLNVTQPLLKGFGGRSTLAENRLAEIGAGEAALRVRASAERLIAQVLVTYAEVVFARENLQVKEDAVKLADDLIRENRRRVEEGMMSPIDVTQAEARRAEAMEEVVSARVFLKERVNRLLSLTQRDYDRSERVDIDGSINQLIPSAEAEGVEMAREALTTNASFLAVLKRAEAEDVRLEYARDQALPQLDLDASLGLNGLAGDYSDSFSDYGSEGRSPDWSMGVTFSVPLDRKAERAQVRIAKRAKERALMEIKQAEIELLVELENAVQQYRASLERMEFVKEAVRLAEEGLRSEERRLASGVTTSYNVLNQQRDLSFARTRALAVEVESFSALVQLYLIKGNLSETLNINLNTGEMVAKR
ncbi:MAG: TolC family protein [Opitutales bacterium]